MCITVSPAQIGVIFNAIQEKYQSDSEEMHFAWQLADEVYKHFTELFGDIKGRSLYEDWLSEFDIF